MIIVKVVGGLGNQMFIYAYAKALQSKGYVVKLDLSDYIHSNLHGGYQLGHYDIDLPEASQEEIELLYRNNRFDYLMHKLGINWFDVDKRFVEKSLNFDEVYLSPPAQSLVQGYFQSDKYFFRLRSLLLNHFSLQSNVSSYTNEIASLINASPFSCSVHVRRGDYLSLDNQKNHCVCDLDYYNEAMQLILGHFPKTSFFLFSDDIKWVKANVRCKNVFYVEHVVPSLPHEDMYLISLCENHIIANSTFSWWGAWLSQNNDKLVIAPKKWFADEKLQSQTANLIPHGWRKV